MDLRVHASGHAHRDEQRTMIELTRPRAFVLPTARATHMARHAELAARHRRRRRAGRRERRNLRGRGERAAWRRAVGVIAGRVATFAGEALAEEILRERGQLGRSGIVVIALWVGADGDLLVPPSVVARGVLDPRDAPTLRGARSAVGRAFAEIDRKQRASDEDVAFAARAAARRYFEAETGGRPVILVTVARG